MNTLIELKNASAGYDDKQILSNVDFCVYDNDFLGVIGPNGGGKTTLVKMLLKQLPLWGGSITYCDNLENNIGYLPQINNIDRQFPISVKEVVMSGLQSRKGIFGRYNSSSDKKKVSETIGYCGIEHISHKSIGDISGGEMQRAFLARALISNPRLLILDEPNTYVDNKFEKELYNLLLDLSSQVAIVMVSHDLGTISSYVKNIVCVNSTVHRHNSNIITQEQLTNYDCPILLLSHS